MLENISMVSQILHSKKKKKPFIRQTCHQQKKVTETELIIME